MALLALEFPLLLQSCMSRAHMGGGYGDGDDGLYSNVASPFKDTYLVSLMP